MSILGTAVSALLFDSGIEPFSEKQGTDLLRSEVERTIRCADFLERRGDAESLEQAEWYRRNAASTLAYLERCNAPAPSIFSREFWR